jgi:hypothetical protein
MPGAVTSRRGAGGTDEVVVGGAGGREVVGKGRDGRLAGGSWPALLRSCIAVSNTSLRVAGRGGMARQLAMLLRSLRASTMMARVRGEGSLRVRSEMVSSSAPSMTFQDAELWTGLTGESLS